MRQCDGLWPSVGRQDPLGRQYPHWRLKPRPFAGAGLFSRLTTNAMRSAALARLLCALPWMLSLRLLKRHPCPRCRRWRSRWRRPVGNREITEPCSPPLFPREQRRRERCGSVAAPATDGPFAGLMEHNSESREVRELTEREVKDDLVRGGITAPLAGTLQKTRLDDGENHAQEQ